MTRQFDTEQLVSRWEDRRQILNRMGTFSLHYLLKREKEIYQTFWADREDISLGVNQGYYYGPDAVQGYFDGLHRKNLLTSRLIQEKYPDKLGGKTPEEVYGVGIINYKPIDTPVLELSWDGKTAKGIWACRNSYNDLTAGGPVAYYAWGWIAADFIRTDSGFRIWHLLMLDDIDVQAGLPYNEREKPYPEVPEFAEMKSFHMPQPNIPCTLRAYYTADRPFTQPPRLPEPYDTFDNTFSYGYQKEG